MPPAPENAAQGQLLQYRIARSEARAQLENAYPLLLPGNIETQRLNETGQQVQAHDRLLGRHGVAQPQRLGGRREQILQARIHEAVGNGLLIAEGRQHPLQPSRGTPFEGHRSQLQIGHRLACRHVVVPVYPADLLDEIRFANDVEAMAGSTNRPANALLQGLPRGHDEVEPCQGLVDDGRRDLRPEEAVEPALAQTDVRHRRQRIRIHGLRHRSRLAANDIQEQAGRSLHGRMLQLEVHAPLVAVRRVGVQRITARGARHGQRCEVGAFQKHVRRSGLNAAAFPAHDTGDGDRPVPVGDQQRVGVQPQLLPVEQGQALIRFCTPHHDTVTEPAEIERVHRLAELQHHVVGDVHDRIDAAHPAATQLLGEPERARGRWVDPPDHPAEISRAAISILDLDAERILHHRRDRLHLAGGNSDVVEHAHLPGQPPHAEAIAPIRREIQVDHHVVERQRLAQVVADTVAAVELEDAAVIVSKAQLGRAA